MNNVIGLYHSTCPNIHIIIILLNYAQAEGSFYIDEMHIDNYCKI